MKKLIVASLSMAVLVLGTAGSVFANASVTTLATANMAADTAGGVYTTLTGPVVTEGANRDIGGGSVVLNAPAGFAFNPAATVSAIVTRVSGVDSPVTLSAPTGTVTTSSITITVSAQDTAGTTLSSITWSGIQVRPIAGTPLVSGNITKAAGGPGIAGIIAGSTSFGTLTEIVGAPTKVAFTTQPTNITAGATMGSFVVQIQDRFTNAVPQSGTTITLTLNGSTLFSGTNPRTTDAAGKATFNDFVIRQAGAGLSFTTANGGGLTNTTSTNFTVSVATAATVNVETVANGSGSTVGPQNITAGNSLQVFAITRDAFGNFVANPSSTWSLTNITGGVVSGNLTPASGANATFTGHFVGTAMIRAINGTFTNASGTLTVVPGVLARYVVSATTPQTRGTAFNVAVTAQDANTNTVTGDSSTVVTLTSSTGNLLFDGNGDSSFNNNTKALSSGAFTINSKDSLVENLTITAADGNGKTGTSASIAVNPVTGDYRSAATGNWDTAGSWQTWNGTAWVTASTPPSGTAGINISILSGNTITLRTQTGTLVLVGNLSVQGALTLNPSATLQVGSGGTAGSLSGNVTDNGALVFNHSDAVAYGGVVSGSGTVMNQGSGTLTLSAANTHSGDTRIVAGTLVLGNSSALQNSALDMNSADSGTLGFGSLTAATFGGLKGSRNLGLANASSAAVALTVGNNAASTAYSGVLSGSGSLMKVGAGTLTLTGNNTFSGALTVRAGTVSIPTINDAGAAGPLGQSANAVTLGWTNTLGTLEYTGATASSTKPFAIGANGDTSSFGAVIQVDTAGTVLTLSGQINQVNQGLLTKTGPGTLLLAGTDDNVGLGVLANAGTVVLAKTSNSGVHALGGAGFTLGGGTVQLGGTGGDQVYDFSFVTVNSGTCDFNGLNETLPAIAGSGGKILNNGGGVSTMTVGVDNGSRTYSGTIADNTIGGGTMALVKIGSGTQTLGGTNTYTGATTIRQGEVTIDGNTGHLADNSGVVFAGTGAFNYDNTGAAGAISEVVGTLTLSVGDATIQSTRTANQNTTLTFGSLAGRTPGATANFLATGTGSGASANQAVLTGQGLGFINQGMFYGGANYAYMNATSSYVRAAAYGSDTNFVTVGAGATIGANSGKHMQITGAISAQTTISILTLKINGANNVTLAASQTLTLSDGGLLKAGTNAATIAGGTGITAGSSELVVRTDHSSDSLTISTPILSSTTGGLTKSGAGTLVLSGIGNAYSGVTTINAGTLDVQKDGGLGSGNVSVTSGATLKLELGTANNYINDSSTLLLSGTASVNLAFTGTDTIGSLSFDGVPQVIGTWGAVGSTATHQSSRFTGSGLLNVTGVSPTISVGSSANPSTYNQSVTFTAFVTGAGPTPTGTVTFKDGANILATVALDGTAHATFTTNTLTAAAHSITAVYSGDTIFASGTSSSLTQTVNAHALLITANSTSKTYGQTVTFVGTEFTSSGLVNGDTVTGVTLTSAGAPATVTVSGSPYTIVPTNATGTGLSNYTITYAAGSLTVSTKPLLITANSTSKTYGQLATFVGTEFTPSGLINGDTVTGVTLTSAGAPATVTVSGSPYTIVPTNATGTGLSNYTITYAAGSLTVSTKPLLITVNSTGKTYGQTVTFAGTEFTPSGLVNGDTVTGVTLTSAGASATATVAGSPYSIVPSDAIGTGLGNYTIAFTNGVLTVNTKTLTITAGSTSKTYGETVTFAGTEFTPSGLINGDSVVSVTLTSDGAAASATVAGSPYSIVASDAIGTGLGNYAIAFTNGVLTVNTKQLTITANSTNKVYGQTATFAGTEFTPSGLINGDSVVSVTLTSDGAAASATVAGSPYSIVPSDAIGTGLGNYAIAFTNGVLTVNTKTLTITADRTSKTYGQTVTFAGTEFTPSGLINGDTVTGVTLTSAGAPATATVAGSPYSIVPSDAIGTGLGNYTITFTNGVLTVNTNLLTITANSTNKVYGQTLTFAGTEFTASGLINGDSVASVTLTSDGAAASATAAGSPYSIVPSDATGAGLGNYAIVYVNGVLVVNTPPTIDAIADRTVYVDHPAFIPLNVGDAETATNNLQLSLVTSNPTLVTPENVVFHFFLDGHWYLTMVPTFGLTGTATNTVTVSDGTNSATTSFVLTVTPPPLRTARFANSSPITIPDSGPADPYPSTINVTGMSGTITNVDLTVSKFAHTYPADVHMLLVGPTGQAVVIWSHCGGGASVTNDTVTLTDSAIAPLPDEFEIWSELLRPADRAANNPPINNTNDFPAPAPGAPYTNPVALSSYAGLTANGTWSLYVYDDSPPDHGIIEGGWSLMITTTGGQELNVVGITAPDKVYDGTTSATINTNAATLVGVTGGGDVTLVTTGASGAFADKNVGTNKTVQIAGLTTTGADAGNYTLIQPMTTGAITARGLTVSATTDTKGYDGMTDATVTLTDNRIGGDDLTNSYTTASFNNKNVGTSKPVHVAGIAVSGSDAGNYTFNTATDTTGDITARVMTVTAVTDTKGYDGTASSTGTPTITSGSLVSGDTVTWTQSFDNKNAGMGKTLIPTGTVNDSNTGNNYSVAFVDDTTGVITPASLAVTATGLDKPYDGTTAAAVSLSDNRILGDSFTASYGAALFADKNAGNAKPVSVSGITISGTDAGNYTANTNASTSATIMRAPVTGSITASDKVYDGNATATISGYSLSGAISNDVVSLSGGTANFADKNVGDNKSVTASGLGLSGGDAGNYALASDTANTTASITPASLTVTADHKSRPYAQPNPPLTASFTGFASGDDTNNAIAGTPDLSTTALTNSDMGTYPIAATNGTLSAANYTLSFVDGTLTIGKALLTVTADDQSRPYGATNPVLTVSYAGFLNGDDTNVLFGLPDVTTTADTNSSVAGGPYTISVTNGTLIATNYDFAFVSGSLTVTPAVVTVTADNQSMVYGTAVPALTASYTGFVNGEDTNVLSGTPDLSTDATATSPVVNSPYPIVATNGTLSANNYTLAFVNGTLAVTPASVTGSITASDKPYDGNATATINSYNLSGTVGGDDVSLTGGSASFNDKNVGSNKPVNASGLSLTGTNASNYSLSSDSASTTASISARSLVVTATGVDKTYDGTTVATVTLADNKVSGDDTGPTYTSASFTDKNVAIGKTVNVGGIALGGADAGNYTPNTTATASATIMRAPVTGSITASDKPYDGNATATISGYSLSGAISNDVVSLSGGTANFVDKNVGDNKSVTATGLGLSGGDAGNYSLASGAANTTASITPASLTVTADHKSRPYAQPNPPLTASYTGFASGDDTNNAIAGTPDLSTTALTNSDMGTYPIAVTNGTLSAANYTLSFVDGTLTIGKAQLTVTANDQSRPYGATNPVLTVTYTGFLNGDDTNVLFGLPDVTTTADTNSTVAGGPYTISVTNGTLIATNYDFAFVSGSLTVTPAVVTVTADNQSMVYGTAVPALTASYTGFVNGEDTNVLSGTPDLSTDATATSPVVNSPYTIVATNGTLSADNYTVAFVNGTLAVTPASVTGSITASDKPYDGNATATINGYNLSGTVGGDDVSLTGGSASFNDKNVGPNKPVNASGLSLTGTNASNYSLSSDSASTTASISARSLVVTATGVDKTYDGTTAATVTLADNRISGDDTGPTYTSASFTDKNVAIGKTVNVGGIALGGADAGNYTPNTTATASATIMRAPVTGSITASDKPYDGNATATISGYSLSGAISNDVVSLSGGTANFVDKNVGDNKSVTATGLGLSGGDAGNYALASGTANTTANITPVSLTVTADNKSKTAGLPNPMLTATYVGFVNGEDTNALTTAVSLSTTATDSSPVGVYSITVSDGVAPNYTIGYTDGTMTVQAMPQLSIVKSGTQAIVTCPATISTQMYQFEYKDDLSDATWTLLGSLTAGNGGSIVVTNEITTTKRFFRIDIAPGQ